MSQGHKLNHFRPVKLGALKSTRRERVDDA